MIYTLCEKIFVGYSVTSLDLISILSILFGTLVIISKNPIISILYLIGLFLSIACYLILIGLNFIGLSYLLVYVGAISILFLFIIMLINVRVSDLLTNNKNSISLAAISGIFFNHFANNILPNTSSDNTLYYKTVVENLYNVTSKSWDGYLTETSHITSIGNIIYANYSIWLIITSIILLLAMVGAIVITLNPENNIKEETNIKTNSDNNNKEINIKTNSENNIKETNSYNDKFNDDEFIDGDKFTKKEYNVL